VAAGGMRLFNKLIKVPPARLCFFLQGTMQLPFFKEGRLRGEVVFAPAAQELLAGKKGGDVGEVRA